MLVTGPLVWGSGHYHWEWSIAASQTLVQLRLGNRKWPNFAVGNGWSARDSWLPPAPENWATVVSFILAGEEVLPHLPAGDLGWALQ